MNKQDTRNCTALLHAADNGHYTTFELLIKAEADVNKHDENGHTALMIVARFTDEKWVRKYLKSGVLINLVDNKNQNALTRHLMKCNKDVIMLLFAAGETVDGTTVDRKQDDGSTRKVPVPDYLLHEDLKLNLKHLAREAIRKHLIPSSINEYLLYNVSLDD